MRPTNYSRWADNETTDPITGAENKLQPTAEFQLDGLQRGEPLPRAFLNYQFDSIYEWQVFFDNIINLDSEATDQDATPDVDGVGTLIVSNTAATTITDFDTTETTKPLTVIATNGNTTIQNNANIVLEGGVNLVMATNDVVNFKRYGGVWIETSRSIK